jgi:hypothetical protein
MDSLKLDLDAVLAEQELDEDSGAVTRMTNDDDTMLISPHVAGPHQGGRNHGKTWKLAFSKPGKTWKMAKKKLEKPGNRTYQTSGHPAHGKRLTPMLGSNFTLF